MKRTPKELLTFCLTNLAKGRNIEISVKPGVVVICTPANEKACAEPVFRLLDGALAVLVGYVPGGKPNYLPLTTSDGTLLVKGVKSTKN